VKVQQIADEFLPNGVPCIIDVGASNGVFLTEWKRNNPNSKIVAIEPGKSPANECRQRDIEVYECAVEEAGQNFQLNGNLVTCFEVLEHVQNPNDFVKAIYDVTAVDGVAVLSCLGGDGFDIRLLWDKSQSIMPPYHLNFLSKQGIRDLFKRVGFRTCEIRTPGRLDVEIVANALQRGEQVQLSKFESKLLNSDQKTRTSFQEFLADNGLSSHVWVIATK
jgi:hypothetical protein